ncbi:MAG TPA: thiamine pyrophosphate-dependent enzyme, partial [Aquabacterium sp.]|nr:thiamine pyrophosphate-dependent enzyme [Aquabacterium sp.]
CFFGDGAACEGIFHESLNLAAVWRLPILFVCENNQWQAFVRRHETMVGDHISPWVHRYGMPGLTVDGNDVEAVQVATQVAIAHIERTGQPYLLETWTWRQKGHFSGDNEAHITAEERAPWQELDPIQRQQRRLSQAQVLSAAAWSQIQARVQARIDEAMAFAQVSPFPSVEQLLTDVYA